MSDNFQVTFAGYLLYLKIHCPLFYFDSIVLSPGLFIY